MSEAHQLLEDHLQAGRLDQAESVAHHLLARRPSDVGARVALARLAAARGDMDAAGRALADLVAENPNEGEPLAFLAVLKEQRGDRAEARLAAERAVSLGAEVPSCLCLLADLLLDEGRIDDAAPLYQRALSRAPALSGAWLGLARVLAFRDQLAEAEDAYVNAVQHGPQRVEAWVELVQLERDAGAVEVAEENLALALRTHPGHPDLVALARENEALPGDPVEAAIHDIRALLFRRDHAGALYALDRLVIEHPEDPRLVLAKAEVHIATGHDEAAPLVHELTRLVRQLPNAWEPKAVLGRLLLRPSPLLNPRMAAAHCEDAWRTSGEHPYAGLGLVEAWAALGKRAFAMALCQRLAEGEGPEAEAARAILAGRIDD